MRLITVLALQIFFGINAYSQFNNILLAKAEEIPQDLFLDTYGFGASAAWSLRKLDKDYTGNAVQIRRSSDNATLDVGFSGNQLDTTAIKDFCSGVTCFVRTWYDQSGNGNNAVQTGTTLQPVIYESGAVVRTGGTKNLPSIRWDATDDNLPATINNISTTSALDIFCVYSSNLAAAADVNTAVLWNIAGNSNASMSHASITAFLTGERMQLNVRHTGSTRRIGSNTYTRNANTLVVENSVFLTSGTSFFQNNAGVSLNLLSGGVTTTTNCTPSASTLGTNAFNIGSDISGPFYANQRISEMIVYLADKSTDRSAMTSAINTFYSIY